MAGIKIVDYATDRKTKTETIVTNAQAALIDAQSKLAASQTAHDAAVKDVSDLTQEMADLRRRLAAIVLPADAKPLLDQLTADITTMRSKAEALLDAEEDLFYRQRTIARAQSLLAAAGAMLASANAGKTAADAGEADRQQLRDAITQSPLKTMKADAATLMAGPAFTNARNRLRGGDLPNDLFDRAVNRGDEATAAIDAAGLNAQWAENVVNEDVDATQGLAGAVASAKTTFERSQDAFRTYIATAAQEFQRAQAILTAIPGAPQPSPAEAAQISDATKQAARDAALVAEAALAQAKGTYDAAQASVDKATWEAVRNDADANPNTDAGAVAAIALRDGAILTALNAAKAAFTPAMQATLDEWQTDVPDATWGVVSNFQIAHTILVDLANTDPTVLQTQMDSDEHPYAQALSDQAHNERALLLLADAVQQRADWRDSVARTQAATVSSAVRGSA
jgi:hypothetical protein